MNSKKGPFLNTDYLSNLAKKKSKDNTISTTYHSKDINESKISEIKTDPLDKKDIKIADRVNPERNMVQQSRDQYVKPSKRLTKNGKLLSLSPEKPNLPKKQKLFKPRTKNFFHIKEMLKSSKEKPPSNSSMPEIDKPGFPRKDFRIKMIKNVRVQEQNSDSILIDHKRKEMKIFHGQISKANSQKLKQIVNIKNLKGNS